MKSEVRSIGGGGFETLSDQSLIEINMLTFDLIIQFALKGVRS